MRSLIDGRRLRRLARPPKKPRAEPRTKERPETEEEERVPAAPGQPCEDRGEQSSPYGVTLTCPVATMGA